jgi:hypothetical protein
MAKSVSAAIGGVISIWWTQRHDQVEETLADIAHSHNVSATTISRLTT